MHEQDFNIPESKFISSLAKTLQILCNGQIDFKESIELVGYINLRVDRRLKLDYVVDEQASKEGNDSSAKYISNSYHSTRPMQNKELTNESESSQRRVYPKQNELTLNSMFGEDNMQTDNDDPNSQEMFAVRFNVSSQGPRDCANIKMEGKENSKGFENDCWNPNSTLSDTGNFVEPKDAYISDTLKKQRLSKDQGTSEIGKMSHSPHIISSSEPKAKGQKELEMYKQESDYLLKKSNDAVESVKNLVTKLGTLCETPVMQEKLSTSSYTPMLKAQKENTKITKKKLFESFGKDKVRKMKEILRTKKGKRRRHELKILVSETGLNHDQLLLLAHNVPQYNSKINWKGIPDGPDKREMLREHRKALRARTQDRQERLLEMAELLKRNQLNEQGITIISKGTEDRKCTLNKSSVSVVSHHTQQLTLDNIEEAVDALTGKVREQKRATMPFKRADKIQEDLKLEAHKKHVVKRKMKQIISKILSEVSEAGYRVVFTNTVGSDAGSHSAELVVVPLKVDEFLPENKETDIKSEMSEEEYAKQLEREQFIEKQKANEDKMKELEDKLSRILTGTEEIYIPTRRRFVPGDIRPTDAERMKDFRKRMKQDLDKFQMYKQKRALGKKRRRLSSLAAKVKDSRGRSQVLPPVPPGDDSHVVRSGGSLVAITQPSLGTMHMPQVYVPPPPPSAVNVHHSGQYVGQGIHNSHQQPMPYGNDEMDIEELIAATQSVQNQHFA